MKVVGSVPLSVPSFEEFWSRYPRHVAKAHALKMWSRMTPKDRIAAYTAIPKHVALWEHEGRPRDKIPHAGTWLNPVDGRRWEDEVEIVVETPKQDNRWWTSEEATLKVAAKLGLRSYGGEDWQQFRKRIADALRSQQAAA